MSLSADLPFEPTHYQRLGLAEDCTEAEIEIAWHRVSADLPPPRPDVQRLKPPASSGVAAAEAARTAQRRADDRRLAHAVLSDPARRAVYDAWLVRERTARSPQGWLARLRGR
ncbi:MAG: hypothetical protein RL654_3096 [Pseudomonadota bacterium]|jgi:DnaJ-class molecular chaperone